MKISHISVLTTTRPPTDAELTLHRNIRLDSLRFNPESFSGDYAHEAKLDHAVWREKWDREGVWIFYAQSSESQEFNENVGDQRQRNSIGPVLSNSHIHTYNNLQVHHHHHHHHHHLHVPPSYSPGEIRTNRGADVHVPTHGNPWLATITLLSPSHLSSVCVLPTTSKATSSLSSWPFTLGGPHTHTELWLIISLWVRPEARCMGIGNQILQKAVHFVHHSTPIDSSFRNTLVLIEVHKRNTAAINLYKRAGFKILSDPSQSPSVEPAQSVSPLRLNKNGANVCDKEECKVYWMGYTIPRVSPLRPNL